ncbi:MAG: hypothetical protein H6R18_1759 [Proteobacteria bacterium]|nr:hypothetical protein [Pseudomonadota bacterium]
MWKIRVKAILQTAIDEVIKEQQEDIDPSSTIRTELDHMVRRTRLVDLEQRLRQMLLEVEGVPELKEKKPDGE